MNRARIIHQSGIVIIMILHMLGQQTVSLAAQKISRRLESRWIYSISLLDYFEVTNDFLDIFGLVNRMVIFLNHIMLKNLWMDVVQNTLHLFLSR